SFFFSSRRRHTRFSRDWSSDVCSSDLILALAFVAALGPGIVNAIIAIAITSWPPYARIARAETLTIRNSDFVVAVRLQGASPFRSEERRVGKEGRARGWRSDGNATSHC